MAKQKYYVVWNGRTKGVFSSWAACKQQIDNFPGAIYKSFETSAAAEQAFGGNSRNYIGTGNTEPTRTRQQSALIGKPIVPSIVVDGAWNTSSGDAEYQGMLFDAGEMLFRMGPFRDGTNNIVEFLAIVHALAYCKQANLLLPIYSDSRNAIGWVKKKQAATLLQRTGHNAPLFDLIERAEKWLVQNVYPNQVLKWETKAWGENPADFGRK